VPQRGHPVCYPKPLVFDYGRHDSMVREAALQWERVVAQHEDVFVLKALAAMRLDRTRQPLAQRASENKKPHQLEPAGLIGAWIAGVLGRLRLVRRSDLLGSAPAASVFVGRVDCLT